MNTVIGVLATEDGVAHDPTSHRRAWATRSSDIRASQASRIPVDLEHDGQPVGEVIHLERDRHGSLWAVAQVDAAPTVAVRVGNDIVDVPTELYFSLSRTPFDEDILIRSVALTSRPARISARPVTWYPGGLVEHVGWHIPWQQRDLIHRANESRYTRHRGSLVIHDTRPAVLATRVTDGLYLDDDGEPVPLGGPWLHRPGRILSVT